MVNVSSSYRFFLDLLIWIRQSQVKSIRMFMFDKKKIKNKINKKKHRSK